MRNTSLLCDVFATLIILEQVSYEDREPMFPSIITSGMANCSGGLYSRPAELQGT